MILVGTLELAEHKVAGDDLGSITLGGGVGLAAKGAVQLSLRGGDGLNIVGEVVGSVAREDGAARHQSLDRDGVLAGGPHLVDTIVVISVDNGGDIKVSNVVPALEGNLTEHAAGVVGTLRDGVPVANPTRREGDSLGAEASNLDRVDLGVARARSEDDLAGGAVLADKGDSVGSTGNSGSGSDHGGDLGEETHFD
jgi:hypothetical protein